MTDEVDEQFPPAEQPEGQKRWPLGTLTSGAGGQIWVEPMFCLSPDGSQWVLQLQCRWPADPTNQGEGFGMAALITDTARGLLLGEIDLDVGWDDPEES